MTDPLNQIICDHCKEWTSVEQYFCQHCGEIVEEERLEEERIRHENTKFDLHLIPIRETDHLIVKGIKHIIRTVQIVYFTILSIILWLIAMTPG